MKKNGRIKQEQTKMIQINLARENSSKTLAGEHSKERMGFCKEAVQAHIAYIELTSSVLNASNISSRKYR